MNVTLNYIKEQVFEGKAIDVSHLSYFDGIKEIEKTEEGLTLEGVSFDNSYPNGAILLGNKTGNLYAYTRLTIPMCVLINADKLSAEYSK